MIGVGDSVRCYHCGGGLRNWEDGDEPILEHARWYPDCGHVLLVKGPVYVKDVLEGNRMQTDCSSEMVCNHKLFKTGLIKFIAENYLSNGGCVILSC